MAYIFIRSSNETPKESLRPCETAIIRFLKEAYTVSYDVKYAQK